MAEIKLENGSLFVYTHWNGAEFPEMARDAIEKAKGRWDDEGYATRIIVDQLTKPGRDEETGFGLMLGPDAEDSYNNDSPSILIDLVAKQLTVVGEGAVVASFYSTSF